ncbi:MAG: branched-chain amino acid ABC transporter permease [Desulfobacterota bacterium]|jgi:branched-chain amino acid transport system permease protein|nr:branched-chain amino acid ABC transporter permease [Thermodesulfobacteriota bacterium]
MNSDVVLQLGLQGFLMGGVYGLIALGLSLIFGVMKVINFAHGEMMVFAMFLSITLLLAWGIDPYLSLLIIAALMFGVGYLVQRIFVNRILDLPEAMQVLVLVGLGIIFENGTLMIWGGSDISPKTSLALSSLRWGPVTVDVPRLIAFALAIIITLAVLIFLKKTTIGKAIRAAADNRFGALIIGTHINRLYGICFGIGAACVGAAGALLVPLMPAKATMGAPYTMISFVIVILGGMGSLVGALVGGLIIGVAESLGTVFLPSSMKQVVSFTIMVVILLLKPQGLFGAKS